MINRNNIFNYKDCEGNWYIPDARKYFDAYSYEFKSMKLQDKINNLGFLIAEGMELPEIIIQYCDNHSSYIIETVKTTLLGYIQQMRWGKSFHFTDVFFEDMTEVELAMLLQKEIDVRYILSEVNCSNWDKTIFDEMCKCADNDRDKLIVILQSIEFSKLYQNKYSI